MDLVGLLADGDRLRVFAAVVLGNESLEDVRRATSLDARAAATALTRLVHGGLLDADAHGYHVQEHEIRAAARAGRPATVDEHADEPGERARVLRAFVKGGRLQSIPATRSKRKVILEVIAQDFEPGRHYTEKQVNLVLGTRFADTAALRRYLVDEGYLERDLGGRRYWRSGGPFEP